MSIGLCLPGGGAKGAFQAGVLKSLYERGVKTYDSYACTSIGAINGYCLYTGNVDNLEKMWISDEKIGQKQFKSVDNIIDNAKDLERLYELNVDNKDNNSSFYINFLKVGNKNAREVIVDISKLSQKEAIENIKYSCALPYTKDCRLFTRDELKEAIIGGVFDGRNLDGGMARNTYFDPLLEENVDKLLIISTRAGFKLPEKVLKNIDESKLVIISPESEVSNEDMLNFSKEICEKMYFEGYKIGEEFNLDLLK